MFAPEPPLLPDVTTVGCVVWDAVVVLVPLPLPVDDIVVLPDCADANGASDTAVMSIAIATSGSNDAAAATHRARRIQLAATVCSRVGFVAASSHIHSPCAALEQLNRPEPL